MRFPQSICLNFYRYFIELYSHGCDVSEQNKHKYCRQKLDSLKQKLWNMLFVHISQCYIFRGYFGFHLHGVTIKSQGCCYALKRRSQCMIFQFKVLSTNNSTKQLLLQWSEKYSLWLAYLISQTLVGKGHSVIDLVVSVVNETYADWFSTGVDPHRLKHTQLQS